MKHAFILYRIKPDHIHNFTAWAGRIYNADDVSDFEPFSGVIEGESQFSHMCHIKTILNLAHMAQKRGYDDAQVRTRCQTTKDLFNGRAGANFTRQMRGLIRRANIKVGYLRTVELTDGWEKNGPRILTDLGRDAHKIRVRTAQKRIRTHQSADDDFDVIE